MANPRFAFGEGHMTTYEDVFRMDYSNAACLMDCTKPTFVKVCSGFTTMDSISMTTTYFRWYLKDGYLLT